MEMEVVEVGEVGGGPRWRYLVGGDRRDGDAGQEV